MKLISEYYKKQNRLLHESGEKYGQRGDRHLKKIHDLKEEYGCNTILDYGCGTGTLSKKLEGVVNYDPGILEFDIMPEQADLVVCTDVLEHIEPELLGNVLKHLHILTNKCAFFSIATRYDSSKLLPDGTNPHKIVKSVAWWSKTLSDYFVIERVRPLIGEVEIVCTPLSQ